MRELLRAPSDSPSQFQQAAAYTGVTVIERAALARRRDRFRKIFPRKMSFDRADGRVVARKHLHPRSPIYC